MPAIFPVSDLKDNYSAMVNNVSYGRVYFTKNGEGKCALVDMRELEDLDKQKVMILVNLGQRSYNSRTTFPKYSDSVLE